MITLAIPFPNIDPVLVEFGPFAIRWYALAYIAGLVLGWQYLRLLVRRPGWRMTPLDVDDLLFYAAIGIIVGGRLGFVLFYNPDHYFRQPLEIFQIWKGGMSFHGGLMGVVLAAWLFARQRDLSPLEVGDACAAATPIGLFFGRIANFINAELWGRPTDFPWGVIFPGAGPQPRHPSQLYEAALEGLVLFVLLLWLAGKPRVPERHGLLGGVFLTGYALARFAVEFVREPDPQLGLVAFGLTMGQLLSLPMLAAGLALLARCYPGPGSR